MRPVTLSSDRITLEYQNKTHKRQKGWFAGRMSRGDYWSTGIFMLVLFLVFAFFSVLVSEYLSAVLGKLLMAVAYLAAMFFGLHCHAKRCHDIGVSGWLQLVPLFGLVLLFKGGDKGPNDWGPDPLEEDRINDLDLRRTKSSFEEELEAIRVERETAT
jgi:uncharacterized membrane protein YhaH (DUF805 family)